MLLDFSVDWRWVVGGTDVSLHVETWELAREQPDMGTPAWWRGKLVLRPVVGRDLNLDPLTNSLWRQGTICSLTVAGYLVFTGFILLAYYDDWSTAPRLELEVGDVLATRNHRQVIPFGEYNAQSLLSALGIPGVAPAGDTVEISTDLTSPVKVLQELTWVTGLKEWGLPATLFTRPGGQVDYVSPQTRISLTRTLEQVADFTRQRPALEIPGSVIASANLTYLIQAEEPETSEEDERPDVIISKAGAVVTLTYFDSFGRVVREEVYRPAEFRTIITDQNGNVINDRTYTITVLSAYTDYQYYVDSERYSITRQTFALRITSYRDGGRSITNPIYERTEETGKKLQQQSDQVLGNSFIQGQVVAKKMTTIYWPEWRFIPTTGESLSLAYLIEEYGLLGRASISNRQAAIPYILRLTKRALGTTHNADTLDEATRILPTVTEVFPNQQIQFPNWIEQFWNPPESPRPLVIGKFTEVLSEEVEVVGFTGPPVYVAIPWLSVTVDEQPGSPEFQQKIDNLRQGIKGALRAAASWMATEIAGRAFARRIKMPPPPEWLGNPRPWMLARIGNEVFWLVGEVLRGTGQGVEFEATGILAGRPNTIPPGEFPPGMIPPTDLPPAEGQSGLFPPGTIPSFIPLITVAPTRFPKVGIGCEMGAGEVLIIPGDPWLGMAVEIEYEVSAPADTSAIVGIGVGELTEAWLGLAADATYEITEEEEEEEEEDGEVQGLTLEAENGVINNGDVVYDADASSCYAVTSEFGSYAVKFSVLSENLDWERPLRLRLVYKATVYGGIWVYRILEGDYEEVDYFDVSPTTGYITRDLVIPSWAEPFDGLSISAWIDYSEEWGEILLDAIQLAPANGDWPPLNPCSN